MKNISLYIIIALFGLLLFNSCADDDYTEPTFTEPIFEGTSNMSIADLKNVYTSTSSTSENTFKGAKFVTVEEDIIIEGYVVSNDEFGNFYKNLVIQGTTDGSSEGILIQLGENSLYTKYPIGQKVYVKCKGLVLGKYGEQIQLGAGHYWYKNKEFRLASIASPSIDYHVFKDKTPVSIEPKVMKIADLTDANLFTLITIEGVQFNTAANQTWGNIDGDHKDFFPFKETIIVDADGEDLPVFTSDYSKFAYQYTPKGSGSITGVLSKHNSNIQFVVNSLYDVKMSNDPETRLGSEAPSNDGQAITTPVASIDFSFDNQLDKKDLAIEGWFNYIEKGTRRWQGKHFTSGSDVDKYGQATPYGGSDAEMVTWLITQAVDLSSAKFLSLSTAKSFWKHGTNESPFEVLISTDFDGKDVAGATWTPLSGNFADSGSSDNAWIESGNINLPTAEKGFIAFKYSGTSSKTTTYRIDNIKVSE